MGADGKYIWTSESYDLIGCNPRDAEFNHIFALMAVDERAKFKKLFDEQSRVSFQVVMYIGIESDDTNYLQIGARKLYDDHVIFCREGNIRKM